MSAISRGIFTAVGLNLIAWGFYSVCLSGMEGYFSPEAWQPGGVAPPIRALHNALVYLSYGIGFSQALHISPLIVWLTARRRFEFVKGVIIGALITALLCGGCFALVFPYVTSQSNVFWR
ncbi:MAG: hypothetical protein KME13_16700 [Myxacorys californica WJT36-NPBG1]|jgi:hypothetical protein|nr:hypothetical protein [Myxacorys californica WJT36-NPBG1]